MNGSELNGVAGDSSLHRDRSPCATTQLTPSGPNSTAAKWRSWLQQFKASQVLISFIRRVIGGNISKVLLDKKLHTLVSQSPLFHQNSKIFWKVVSRQIEGSPRHAKGGDTLRKMFLMSHFFFCTGNHDISYSCGIQLPLQLLWVFTVQLT